MPANESLKTPKKFRERIAPTERVLVRVFLGACLLMVILVFLVLSSMVVAPELAPGLIVAYRSLLLWSLVIVIYAFYSLLLLVQQIKEDLSRKTFTDELTGVVNFRYLNQRLDEECERARRYGGTASVLFMDLDHFKDVNDRHGHQVGNAVLRGLATAMKLQVRASDVLGRIGGDEFLVLMPSTGQEEALVLAERLRNAVAGFCLDLGQKGMIDFVRVSIGLAVCPVHGDCVDDIVRAADRAVYRAKEQGGNRTYVVGESLAAKTHAESGHAGAMLRHGGTAPDAEAP